MLFQRGEKYALPDPTLHSHMPSIGAADREHIALFGLA
jgi:hypothetical protein